MGAPASISVYNDFTPGESGIAHGASDNEVTAGVDMILGVLVQELGGDNGLDDLFHDILAQGR